MADPKSMVAKTLAAKTLVAKTLVVRGTGSIGLRHLQVAARFFPNVRVVAQSIRPIDPDRLDLQPFEKLAHDQSLAKLSPTWVIVATDTQRHVSDCLEALAAGAHVLVEKPLALSLEQARVLIEAQAAAERKVFVACNLRHSTSLLRFREWLPRIGTLQSTRIECQSYLPAWRPSRDYRQSYSARKNEGGVLRDLVHEIDYALWLFGMPSELFASVSYGKHLDIQTDDTADLFYRVGKNDVSIRLDYLGKPTRRQIVATGSEGTLTWNSIAQSVHFSDGSSADGSSDELFQAAQERDGMMHDQLQSFFRATEGDTQTSMATLEDGMSSLAILDAAYAAAIPLQKIENFSSPRGFAS